MKTTSTAAMMFLGCFAAASGQGSLTPPGSTPAPTMKTLQEIWDRLGELDERVSRMEEEETDEASVVADSLAGLGEALGATTKYNWNLSTIDSSSDDQLHLPL